NLRYCRSTGASRRPSQGYTREGITAHRDLLVYRSSPGSEFMRQQGNAGKCCPAGQCSTDKLFVLQSRRLAAMGSALPLSAWQTSPDACPGRAVLDWRKTLIAQSVAERLSGNCRN